MIRVVIADDAAVILKAVKTLLDGDSRFRVVGEGRTYTETKSLVENLRPDVLLVDLRMPDANSQSMSLAKLASNCECPVVAMSFSID
jgi:chemotaxis response regulator CheB